MRLQCSAGESAHTRFHEFRVIIVIFFLLFSKPAISMQERVDRLILSLSVSRVGGGVHDHQAIVPRVYDRS